MGIKEPQKQQPVAEQRLFNSLLRPQVKKEKQGVAETTGDKPFDNMMKTIKTGTKKQATADRREQKKQDQERTRAAISNMFGNSMDHLKNLKIKERSVAEKMMPAGNFSSTPKNKLGPAGQLKGKMKRPARAGDLVGGAEESYDGGSYTSHKPGFGGQGRYTDSVRTQFNIGENKLVPIGEDLELKMAEAVLKLMENTLK